MFIDCSNSTSIGLYLNPYAPFVRLSRKLTHQRNREYTYLLIDKEIITDNTTPFFLKKTVQVCNDNNPIIP
jgi:hypothetical protein